MNKEPLARSICKRLHDKGYIAYFAGGYVRDQLLGIISDDIDIATDASPEKIQQLFKKTLPIGISFGIVVVVEEGIAFEIATFRKDLKYEDGRRPEEVAFSSPEEDAFRRDFTINGLFYDPHNDKIIDYVEGQQDLKNRVLRAIGDPLLRFQEDRLRMVRACRFAARFELTIEPKTKRAIQLESKHLFPSVSIERIYQEFKKMKPYHFKIALLYLWEFGLLQTIFPQLKGLSQDELNQRLKRFVYLPSSCPVFIYLLQLFDTLGESLIEDLSSYLKISNQETKMAQIFYEGLVLSHSNSPLQKWVHFYAKPDAELCLEAIKAQLPVEKHKDFLEEHFQKQQKLKNHIDRKKLGKPLVTSDHLMRYGIEPGKKLGELLHKAEEIAIVHDCEKPEEALERLKKTPLWREKS